MKNIAFISALLIFAGCQMTAKTNIKSVVDNITYFQDPKSGLYFAAINSYHSGYESTTITWVPANDSVKKLASESNK